jgi:hypothetical protein
MADEFARPEESLGSRREREENEKLIANLSSLSGQYQKAAAQQKLLLPKIILQAKHLKSQIAQTQTQIANEAILLKLTQDTIVSAQQELVFRQQQKDELQKELNNKKAMLTDSQVQLGLDLMMQELVQQGLAIKEQELSVAKELLAARQAGKGATESELQRVQDQLAVQINADILAGKGASESQKELARRKYELIDALGMYDTAIQDAQQSVNQLTDGALHAQRSLAEYNRYVDESTTSVDGLQGEISTLEKTIAKNDQALEKLPIEIARLQSKANKLSNSMAANEEELKTLEIEKVKNALDGISETVNKFAKPLMGFVDKIYETQQTVGVEMGSASRIYGNALLSRAKSLVGLTDGPILETKEIIDATKAFKTEFGTILDPAEATRIAGEAKNLGVSSDEYIKAKRAFLGTGANENTIRQNAIQQFKNAGLAAADAIKFAAENANLLAVAGEKYSDSLFRAAAEAKKIGVNLSDVEKFANNIVGDFEGSLEKFSELSAMGIDLDFNQIAAVSATGTDEEILNTLKQQLQQSGIRGEELQTNRQLRLALTQATGLDESTIMRLSGQAAAPKEKTIPEQQLGVLDKILEHLAGWGTILGTIATSAAAIIPAIMSLRTGGGIAGLLGGGGAAGTASKVSEVSKVAEVTGGEGLTSAAEGTSAFSGNNILKGAAAMLIVAASVYVLAKGLQQFRTVNTDDMIKAGGALGVLALAAWGLSSIAGPIGMGALAIAALGASMIPFAFAMNLAAPGLGTLSSFIGVMSQLNLGQVGILALMGPALASMAVGLIALGAAAVVAAPGLAILGGLQKLGLLPHMPGAGTPVTGPAPAGATGAAANAAGAKLDTSKMEAKLDQVVTAIKGIKIEMDGHTVGRVSLNAASPLGRLAVVG